LKLFGKRSRPEGGQDKKTDAFRALPSIWTRISTQIFEEITKGRTLGEQDKVRTKRGRGPTKVRRANGP